MLLKEANGCGRRQSFYWPAKGADDLGPSTEQRMKRYCEESLPLTTAAAAAALENANMKASQITQSSPFPARASSRRELTLGW